MFLRNGSATGRKIVNVTPKKIYKTLYNANKHGVIRSKQAKAE